ncbi:hypothetical protein RFI_02960 [Reticulomyxa filosa]|uniref:N-acetyltransferase domain-containing protein n=1 Tax=Reticulomyxa filosa TaxID=46433 RepID=X6P7T9_RETFI|nr:hypothetical protein RFI_02960 [Reticulomyxa filosa]|eukprot:ETO34134.1 hypothetical protein RFI_02960 [Reticulomyxa filosa]
MSIHALDLLDNVFELVDKEPVVEYVILKEEHVSEALKVLNDAFQYDEVKEPPNQHVPYRIFIDFYGDWIAHFWQKQTFVAALHKYNRSVIGICLGEHYDDTTIPPPYNDILYDVEKEKPYIEKIFALCDDLKLEWVRKHREKGPMFYIEILAVQYKYRNRGIATNLIRESVRIAQQLKPQFGFHTVFAECANVRFTLFFFLIL